MQHPTLPHLLARLGAAALALLGSAAALAQPSEAWPSRPITLVVPFPAGGVTDVVGRELAQRLAASLGQPVVVDNRAGASGNIGTQAVARAPADGYTLGVLTVSAISIAPHLSRKLGFDPVRDFTPVTNLVNSPGAIIAGRQAPYDSYAAFVRHAKAHPGKVTYASVGPGSIPHLTAEMFARTAGVKMTHVPYKGAAPALQDVIGGVVDISFETSLVTTVTHAKAGRIKVLAVTGPARVPVLPEVPTVAEQGHPGFSAQGWFGLFGPKNLPPAVLEKLHKAATQALEEPALREKFEQLGLQPAPGSPQAFGAFLAEQDRLWGRIARDLNVNLD